MPGFPTVKGRPHNLALHAARRSALQAEPVRRSRRTRSLPSLSILFIAVISTAFPSGSIAAPEPIQSGAAFQCSAKGQVGTVQAASQGLRIKHNRRWKSERKGARLFKGDVLETSKGQKTAVAMCGGGTVYANADSRAAFHSTAEVIDQQGEVAYRTASKQDQTLRTRDARAGSKGAYFDVSARKGSSRYIVARGSIQVQNKRGMVRVTANRETTVPSGRAPVAPTEVDAQTALKWAGPLAERWSILTASGVVLGPKRLVVDTQGNIYVTDPGSTDARVVKLSAAGKTLAIWHLASSTTLPSGIELDRQNNLYVTDEIGTFVSKMNLDGQVVAKFDLQRLFPDTPMSPTGIEVDTAGNMYVADQFLDKVFKVSPSGALLAAWGSEGSAPGQFSYPGDLALDSAGNIYVADTNNFRIQKLSPTGQVLAVWPLGATSPPYDITLDPFGNMYIAASNEERIQELAPDGHTLRTWKNEQSRNLRDPGEFDRPFGVALDVKGNVYVADHYGARIEKLTRG